MTSGLRNGVEQVTESFPLLDLRIGERHFRLAFDARNDGIQGHIVHVQIPAQGQLGARIARSKVSLVEDGFHRCLARTVLSTYGLARVDGRGLGTLWRIILGSGIDQLR